MAKSSLPMPMNISSKLQQRICRTSRIGNQRTHRCRVEGLAKEIVNFNFLLDGTRISGRSRTSLRDSLVFALSISVWRAVERLTTSVNCWVGLGHTMSLTYLGVLAETFYTVLDSGPRIECYLISARRSIRADYKSRKYTIHGSPFYGAQFYDKAQAYISVRDMAMGKLEEVESWAKN
jgi:hypothetical protein